MLGFLHRHGRERVSSRQIAKSVNTNAVVIRNLVPLLKSAGLVDSKEGKSGGLKLARPPSKISLQEVYRAINENKELFCVGNREEYRQCPVSRGMKTVLPSILKTMNVAVEKSLKKKTLQSVMNELNS